MRFNTLVLKIWLLRLHEDEIDGDSNTDIVFGREVWSDSVVEMSDDKDRSPNLNIKQKQTVNKQVR